MLYLKRFFGHLNVTNEEMANYGMKGCTGGGFLLHHVLEISAGVLQFAHFYEHDAYIVQDFYSELLVSVGNTI